jgi:tetratricopeptide (TPR) repeat protein
VKWRAGRNSRAQLGPRSGRIAAGLLVSWLSWPCLWSQGPEKPGELFERGVELLRADRLDEAGEIFRRLLEVGKDPVVYHNLGIVYQRQGRHEQAIDQFRESLRMDPGLAATRALLGAGLLALGRSSEAVPELERAVESRPQDVLIRDQLAEAYRREGRLFEAVDQRRAIRDLIPENPEAAYQLGKAFGELSEWSYREMTRIAPDSARVHFGLGQTFLARGDFEAAARAFERAVQTDPKMPEAHLMYAHALVRLGRLGEALDAVEEELELVPVNTGAKQLRDQLKEALK